VTTAAPSDWRTPRASQRNKRRTTKKQNKAATRRGPYIYAPSHQANIHSQANDAKIPLDTLSYKLYYVNYEISLNSSPVDFL